MRPIEGSIAELARLVEDVTAYLKRQDAEITALAAKGDPFAASLEGRPLREWLAELWPQAGQWYGPAFSLEAAEDELRQRRGDKARLEKQAARRKSLVSRAGRQILAARESSWQKEEAAWERLRRAEAKLKAQEKDLKALTTQAAGRMKVARALQDWLAGIQPVGLNLYRDAKGRPLGSQVLDRARDRMERLKGSIRQCQSMARERLKEQRLGMAAKSRAADRLEQARGNRHRVQREATMKSSQVEVVTRQLDEDLKCLAENNRLLSETQLHLEDCKRLAELAGPLLALALEDAPPDPGQGIEEALLTAKRSGDRGLRLSAISARLKKRLSRDLILAPQAISLVRRVNREIGAAEAALPGLIKPFVGLAVDRIRASAAARITLLLSRLEILGREAKKAEAESARLVPRLSRDIARYRRVTKALKQESVTERGLLAGVGEMVEGLLEAAEEAKSRAELAVETLSAPMACLAELRPLDLAPALSRLVADLYGLGRRARRLEERAAQLVYWTPVPATPRPEDIHQEPEAAVAALRKLKRNRVETGRLVSLIRAAAHWQSMVSGPLHQAIRRPAEQVALQMGGAVKRLSAERVDLTAKNQKAAFVIRGLHHSVGREREIAATASHHLERVREHNRRQGRKLKEVNRELAVARGQRDAALQEMELLKTAAHGELSRLLARKDHTIVALRAKVIERHRALRRARSEIAVAVDEAKKWSYVAARLEVMAESAEQVPDQVVQQLMSEADQLRKQVEFLSQLLVLANLPAASGPARVRFTLLSPEDIENAVKRLGKLRGRLAKLGRSAAGRWAIIGALAGSLVFTPQAPSKATRTESPLISPRQTVHALSQRVADVRLREMAATLSRLPGPAGHASLDLNLLPLRGGETPLPEPVKRQIYTLAKESGLSPEVLLISARAAMGEACVAEPKVLKRLARQAKLLAARHPLIFRELSRQGLPPNAGAITRLAPAPEKAQHLFLDRMYREFRSLGFSPAEALGALTANERASAELDVFWPAPKNFRGQLRPLAHLERLSLSAFLKKVTPYITKKCSTYLKSKKRKFQGNLTEYARGLAFDMYNAAQRFKVPVTFLLAIAHQETWYANVLGDDDLSASPFQIYAPTRVAILSSMNRYGFVTPPKGVALQHHLTMATYMAAYHLRELMHESRRGRSVDMDKVLTRYNGSTRYVGLVAGRQRELAWFLRRAKSKKTTKPKAVKPKDIS